MHSVWTSHLYNLCNLDWIIKQIWSHKWFSWLMLLTKFYQSIFFLIFLKVKVLIYNLSVTFISKDLLLDSVTSDLLENIYITKKISSNINIPCEKYPARNPVQQYQGRNSSFFPFNWDIQNEFVGWRIEWNWIKTKKDGYYPKYMRLF